MAKIISPAEINQIAGLSSFDLEPSPTVQTSATPRTKTVGPDRIISPEEINRITSFSTPKPQQEQKKNFFKNLVDTVLKGLYETQKPKYNLVGNIPTPLTTAREGYTSGLFGTDPEGRY